MLLKIFSENNIVKSKNRHIEINAWKRSLDYMSDENILMKNRLSEILRDEFDTSLLSKLEEFHTSLLKEESFLTLIRHNLTDLVSFHTNGSSVEAEYSKKESLYYNLKDQMETVLIRFNKLKIDFYSFMSERS